MLVFLTALMYGAAVYWIGGGVVYLGCAARGRPAATVARATSWPSPPPRSRSRSSRSGLSRSPSTAAICSAPAAPTPESAAWIFAGVETAFFLWAFALLVYGVAWSSSWKLVRAVGALGLTFFVVIALALLPFVL